MQHRIIFSLTLLTALLLWVTPASAHETADLKVSHLYATIGADDTLDVTMVVDNSAGSHPIGLAGALGVLFDTVTLMQDGQAVDQIIIPTGERVMLQDAGYGIVLTQPETALTAGDAFSLTLTFNMLDQSGTVEHEPLSVIAGVLVVDTFPSLIDLDVMQSYVRPTVSEPFTGQSASMTDDENDDMDMGDDMDMNDDMDMSDNMDMDDMMMQAGNSAVYMVVINRGSTEQRIVGGSSEAAPSVTVHQSRMEDGLMVMRDVDSIEVPAEGQFAMQPGGFHIMLVDVRRPLAVGDAIVLTLQFADGESLSFAVPVYDPLLADLNADHADADHNHADGDDNTTEDGQ